MIPAGLLADCWLLPLVFLMLSLHLHLAVPTVSGLQVFQNLQGKELEKKVSIREMIDRAVSL